MNVEKMEILGFNVANLDEAIKKFSDVLGTTFHKFVSDNAEPMQSKFGTYPGPRPKVAIDRQGLIELVESDPPVAQDMIRNIHFKVPDLEDAIGEMTLKGYRLVDVVHIGNLKEAIFNAEDFGGVRWCLVEYSEPTLVDAMLAHPSTHED